MVAILSSRLTPGEAFKPSEVAGILPIGGGWRCCRCSAGWRAAASPSRLEFSLPAYHAPTPLVGYRRARNRIIVEELYMSSLPWASPVFVRNYL